MTDRSAGHLITAGGLFVVVCILAMLVFLVFETLPLWRSAEFVADDLDFSPGHDTALLEMNEHREVMFAVGRDGIARTIVHATGAQTETSLFPTPESERASHSDSSRAITLATPILGQPDFWVAITEQLRILPLHLDAGLRFVQTQRAYTPSIRVGQAAVFDDGSVSGSEFGVPRIVTATGGDETLVVAVLGTSGRVAVLARSIEESLFGEAQVSDRTMMVPVPADPSVTSLALNGAGDLLYLGTEDGRLLEWSLDGVPELLGAYQAQDSPIRTLGFLIGGNTLLVGADNGSVEAWFRARDEANLLHLIRAHHFRNHGAPVVGVTSSPRNRSFLTWDSDGLAQLHFGTTARTRAELQLSPQSPTLVRFSPKSNGLFACAANGTALSWTLNDLHPEISLMTLFGRVHYEGFAKKEYSWQSTGATDETEPKLSLIPLIFGSLKGTLYAMLFSAPIAILAALYTSIFMRPRLRAIVKPTMELMATIPSVVLGLLAGLWLAPRLQSGMPILLVAGLFLPLVILFAGWLHATTLPDSIRRRIRPGTEGLYLIPVLALAMGVFLASNGMIDGIFPGGFLDWLYQTFGIRYDQRNALVVGIAMGLAVIPIIFSVSEDSLSSVPRHLTAGSLALGATPWQTAWLVILPAASPGIFSALMIGFGRAVGETMIILMATGNTPILDWSIFEGFRTLSANIAVEIPEAPHGGTLYRVLFLSAVLLFLFTLVVNTTAEIVSTRLRKRYSRF